MSSFDNIPDLTLFQRRYLEEALAQAERAKIEYTPTLTTQAEVMASIRIISMLDARIQIYTDLLESKVRSDRQASTHK